MQIRNPVALWGTRVQGLRGDSRGSLKDDGLPLWIEGIAPEHSKCSRQDLRCSLSPGGLPSLPRSHRMCYIWEFQLGIHTFYLSYQFFKLAENLFFQNSNSYLLPNYSFLHWFGILYHFDSLLQLPLISHHQSGFLFLLLLDCIALLLTYYYLILLSTSLFSVVYNYPYWWL